MSLKTVDIRLQFSVGGCFKPCKQGTLHTAVLLCNLPSPLRCNGLRQRPPTASPNSTRHIQDNAAEPLHIQICVHRVSWVRVTNELKVVRMGARFLRDETC